MSQKSRWYTIIIALCLYLISTSIPYALFIKDSNLVFWLRVCTIACFLLIILFYLHRNSLLKFTFSKPKSLHFSFIPFILLCFSNFFVGWYLGSPLNTNIDISNIMKNMLMTVLIAFTEELIFRELILKELKKSKENSYSILISALIFGLMHLTAISSLESIPLVLAQCGYTFVLGLILGFIYVYGNSYIYVFLFHFLFNFLNSVLFENLYSVAISYEYYLINIIVGAIVILYGIILYILIRRKTGVS